AEQSGANRQRRKRAIEVAAEEYLLVDPVEVVPRRAKHLLKLLLRQILLQSQPQCTHPILISSLAGRSNPAASRRRYLEIVLVEMLRLLAQLLHRVLAVIVMNNVADRPQRRPVHQRRLSLHPRAQHTPPSAPSIGED